MKLVKCTQCGKKQPIIGFKLCYDCIQSKTGATGVACATKGCVGTVPPGMTECRSCAAYTKSGYINMPVAPSSRRSGKSDGSQRLVTEDELEPVQQDIQNLRAILAHILDILGNLDTRILKEFPKAQLSFDEAKALLGEVSRSEVIKDLRKWEGELHGDEVEAALEGD